MSLSSRIYLKIATRECQSRVYKSCNYAITQLRKIVKNLCNFWTNERCAVLYVLYVQYVLYVRACQECKQKSLKNPLAFFAAILCILMGYLPKKGFQRIFDGGKLASKRGQPIKK